MTDDIHNNKFQKAGNLIDLFFQWWEIKMIMGFIFVMYTKVTNAANE